MKALAITFLTGVSVQASDDTSGDDTRCGPVLEVRFVESAPRDRFEFTNASSAGWSVSSIAMNLEASAGRLIFDTTDGGKGVDVFQEFRQESGDAMLTDVVSPADGSDRIRVEFSRFDAGGTFRFSIDVDDQLSNSELGQIRVSDSEIAGARISAEFRRADADPVSLSAVFDNQSRALASSPGCT